MRQPVRTKAAGRRALLTAGWAARRSGVQNDEIAALSVFTTQSTTSLGARIVAQVRRGVTPAAVDLNIGPDGAPAVYTRAAIASRTWNQHTSAAGGMTPSQGVESARRLLWRRPTSGQTRTDSDYRCSGCGGQVTDTTATSCHLMSLWSASDERPGWLSTSNASSDQRRRQRAPLHRYGHRLQLLG